MVVGGLVDDRYAIRWSAIGDPTDWPIPNTDEARSKQSGQQNFPTRFGYVTAVFGNDFFMYVFQERAITKATYVGGDIVFSFDTFEEDRGCIRSGLFERIDDMVFFRSDRGYHMLVNDQIQDIGFGVVDDSETAGLNISAKVEPPRVAANPARHQVWWDSDNLCYNYKTGQWTNVPAYAGNQYYTINNTASTIGLIRYNGNAVELQEQMSGGTKQTMLFETASQDINEGGRALINGVRPLTSGGTSTVRIGTQNLPGDSVTYTVNSSPDARSGMANFRAEGRYHRMEMTVNGADTVYGADVDYEAAGRI
ncbi:MAG: hypothetical protein AAGE92_00055 [Cyanobacteria bacterium P01_G01_bin.4]